MDADRNRARRPFLTARWTDLCLYNFAVPDDVLSPHLPPGLELDRYQGQAYVSLVAFQFRDARVWGIGWPGQRNFAEMNLRFYVRSSHGRGVVFIQEFVPKPLVALVACWLYNEPYRTAPLSHEVSETEGEFRVQTELRYGGKVHRLALRATKPPQTPPESSLEHFFKEHRWGFNRDRKGRPWRYEVDHPIWQTCPVAETSVDLDWSLAYGPKWGFLTGRPAESVVFALGSEVRVYDKEPLLPEPHLGNVAATA